MSTTSEPLRAQPDDEPYWLSVRATLKPFYINTQLVNTRRGPAPLIVRERVQQLVDLSLSYELDEYEPMKDMKESGSSVSTRTLLADYFGTGIDEIALTRNAMEGIATVINGFRLEPGDEIIATNLCYDTNIAILRQRAVREGLNVKIVNLPIGIASDQEILKAFESNITEKTKLFSFPHVFATTGLVLPVQAISNLAKRHGAFSFVDGAHSAGHINFRIDELGCDGFAACLHKWMHGPRGTGFLYIRRDRIPDVWPLFAPWSGKPVDSIEKFEEVGTVFKALPAAIPETIAFNREIGQKEKSARLRYLRDRWASPLSVHKRIHLLTDINASPGTGFGAFVIDDMDGEEFARLLLEEFDISVKPFSTGDPSVKAIQLSPGLANTVEEVDRFVEATISILERSAIIEAST